MSLELQMLLKDSDIIVCLIMAFVMGFLAWCLVDMLFLGPHQQQQEQKHSNLGMGRVILGHLANTPSEEQFGRSDDYV
jgi:hypothetical protein